MLHHIELLAQQNKTTTMLRLKAATSTPVTRAWYTLHARTRLANVTRTSLSWFKHMSATQSVP